MLTRLRRWLVPPEPDIEAAVPEAIARNPMMAEFARLESDLKHVTAEVEAKTAEVDATNERLVRLMMANGQTVATWRGKDVQV